MLFDKEEIIVPVSKRSQWKQYNKYSIDSGHSTLPYIDVQSLKTFYLLFTEIFLTLWILV